MQPPARQPASQRPVDARMAGGGDSYPFLRKRTLDGGDLPAKPMKGMGRIQHLFTICSFWANANPSGKPHGSCEQCVRTLKVAVIYVVEEADSLFRRGGRDIGEIDRHADRKRRSEEHTSELQSLMRNSYAVFC